MVETEMTARELYALVEHVGIKDGNVGPSGKPDGRRMAPVLAWFARELRGRPLSIARHHDWWTRRG